MNIIFSFCRTVKSIFYHYKPHTHSLCLCLHFNCWTFFVNKFIYELFQVVNRIIFFCKSLQCKHLYLSHPISKHSTCSIKFCWKLTMRFAYDFLGCFKWNKTRKLANCDNFRYFINKRRLQNMVIMPGLFFSWRGDFCLNEVDQWLELEPIGHL